MADLDDLFDDDVPAKQTVAQRHKSSAVGKFSGGGAAKKISDDLDDLGDSFNFDEELAVGGSKPTA